MSSSFSLSLLKERELPSKELREEFLTEIERNKLLGLYKDINSSAFKSHWMLNQAYFDELASWQLSPSLKGILLKGAHLLEHYYDELGERFMGDIDILIEKERLADWEQFLIAQGFEDITKETWKANDFKRLYLKHHQGLELVIELHTRLFYQEKVSSLWTKAITSPYSGLYYLSAENLFIHLCGHLAYQHTFISLHWLYDIYLFLDKEKNLDISHIKAQAKRAQVWRSVRIIAFLLKEHFSLSIDKKLLPPFIIRFLIKVLITPQFLWNPHAFRWRYLIVKHFTKDHLYQALAYDLGWFKAKGKKE